MSEAGVAELLEKRSETARMYALKRPTELDHMLIELPRRKRCTADDFGFDKGTPEDWAKRAQNGDREAEARCGRALKMFLSLMKHDMVHRPVLDSRGRNRHDEEGNKLYQWRSAWDINEPEARASADNPVPNLNHWYDLVTENWLSAVLPQLIFFDTNPQIGPRASHTAELIAAKLSPIDPVRKATLEWLEAFNKGEDAPPKSRVTAVPAEETLLARLEQLEEENRRLAEERDEANNKFRGKALRVGQLEKKLKKFEDTPSNGEDE